MMVENILSILNKSKADGWAVTDEKINRWEFYFLRHNLDQNRDVNTEHISVTVYKKSDDGKYSGSATQEIAPTVSSDEAEQIISTLIERASLVKNPVYAQREPVSVEQNEPETDISSVAGDFISVMNDIPETSTEDINCYEIFTSLIEKRLITSTGIDITQRYPKSFLEVVTNARNDSEEIELYRSYDSGTCDRNFLKRDISKTLKYGKDRLHTVPTPAIGKISLMLSTADAKQVWDYFAHRVDAALVYQKTSDWKIGEPVAEDVCGDKVTISAKKFLPNSSMNRSYDSEGAPIRDEILIEDSIVKTYWGDQMYSSVMGLDDTFILTNYEVAAGSRTEAELRGSSDPYLEVVEFSDFQVDVITGNILGEIRLGYLHSGSGVTIVSGGSVSGSMRGSMKSMHFSNEMTQYDNARVPSVVVLDDVTVTGAK